MNWYYYYYYYYYYYVVVVVVSQYIYIYPVNGYLRSWAIVCTVSRNSKTLVNRTSIFGRFAGLLLLLLLLLNKLLYINMTVSYL
jgi:hypothetical protein